MPQRAETIESLPMAFEVVKQMQADGLEWGEGHRPLGRPVSAATVSRVARTLDATVAAFDARLLANAIERRFRKVRRRTCDGGAPRRIKARTDRSRRNRRIF